MISPSANRIVFDSVLIAYAFKEALIQTPYSLSKNQKIRISR